MASQFGIVGNSAMGIRSYQMPDGSVVQVTGDEKPPEGGVLMTGGDSPVDAVSDVVDFVTTLPTDPVGAVEDITGVTDAKDEMKKGIDEAAAGAREAGDDVTAKTDEQRDRNEEFFDPAEDAAKNLAENGPTTSQDFYTNMGPGPSGTADYAANYDPNKVEDANVDLANELAGPAPELRQAGALGAAQEFSTNAGLSGQRYADTANQNLVGGVENLAGQRLAQEDMGLIGGAYDRAAGYEGTEYGSTVGLNALKGAEIDPEAGTYLGAKRAGELAAFENTPGSLETELAERRAGTGLYGEQRAELLKELQRSAAARGGFNSGDAMKLEYKGLNDLAIKELQDRANMAGKAQELRQGRTKDVSATLSDAEKYRLGRQGINTDVAGKTAQTATELDRNAGRAVEIQGGIANMGESTITERRGQSNELTTDAAKLELQQSAARDALAAQTDEELTERFGIWMNALSDTDKLEVQERLARGELRKDILSDIEDRKIKREQIDLDATTAADKLELDYGRLQMDAAGQSSEERQKTLQATFDAFAKLGLDKATLDTRLTEAEIEGTLETELAALDAELAKAGIDLQTRTAMIKNITEGVKLL